MATTHLPDAVLRAGMRYLEMLLCAQIDQQLGRGAKHLPPLRLPNDLSPLSCTIQRYALSEPEQVIFLLALAPEADPALLERVLRANLNGGPDLPALGGIRGSQHRGILPTGETAQFLLAGDNLLLRQAIRQMLAADGNLRRHGLIDLLPAPIGEPALAGQLIAQPEWVEQILTGKVSPPAFSSSFPAERVETPLEWTDLVLPERSLTELNYLRNYLATEQSLAGNSAFGKHSRRGYRALFHGPPGTGKTLSAALLGRATERPVFRVDLSMVVSKWIGETEKNLANLFQRAESKGWILFFDEADALFGKRSEVKESNSQYANQTTSFLLQRVENYDGLCILATNFRSNLDRAFTRRFEAIVPFFPPGPAERLRLWQSILPPALPLEAGLDAAELAEQYELTGASIANVVRHAVLESLAAGASTLSKSQLLAAIVREYAKEDRVVKPGIH